MHVAIFLLNIAVALALGIIIGFERQWRQHTAGLRTNALVTLGAAMFVSLALMVEHDANPTRIAAQVVSGLGFLGGGVILREGLNVKGMNTAATIWCSGAVGTLAGSGFLLEAAIATAAVLFVNIALRPVVRHMEAQLRTATDVETYYRLRVVCQDGQDAVIRSVMLRHIGNQPRMSIQGISTEETDKGRLAVVADVYAAERNDRFMEQIVARIGIEPHVLAVSWEKVSG
jgi:putative Mg2+ transporter-C (MgtC) family protein